MKLKTILVILLFNSLTAYCQRKDAPILSTYTGFSLMTPKMTSPNASFKHTLGFEFQHPIFKHKNRMAYALELEYNYLYIFRDSNVYELLKRPQCNPNHGGLTTGITHCPYFYTEQGVDLNLPFSYNFIYFSNKNLELFFKGGALVRFSLLRHLNMAYPKLSADGLLLDVGPFSFNDTGWGFKFLNYDVTFGTGINYRLYKNLHLTTLAQYRYSFKTQALKLLYTPNNVYWQIGIQNSI